MMKVKLSTGLQDIHYEGYTVKGHEHFSQIVTITLKTNDLCVIQTSSYSPCLHGLLFDPEDGFCFYKYTSMDGSINMVDDMVVTF
jgi:hypothetical protein